MTLTAAYLLIAHLLALSSLWTVPAPAQGTAQGRAVWPLDPRPEVAEGFDPPAEQWGAGHRGVDLRGRPGQIVHAAQDGTVTFTGRLAGRGVVVVDHGATRTTYEPVTASVTVGQRVHAGRSIGRLETFGSHCWPQTCLHWGLIEDETYLDPLTLVGSGPVRLLPLFGELPGSTNLSQTAIPHTWGLRPGGGLVGRPAAAGLW